MLQRTFVVVIPHQQHGGLVVGLSMVWLPAQKPVIGAQGRSSSRLIALGRLHVDPAKVQICTGQAWVVQNCSRELPDGAVPMALLHLDHAQKIFQSPICRKLRLGARNQRPGAVQIVLFHVLLDLQYQRTILFARRQGASCPGQAEQTKCQEDDSSETGA